MLQGGLWIQQGFRVDQTGQKARQSLLLGGLRVPPGFGVDKNGQICVFGVAFGGLAEIRLTGWGENKEEKEEEKKK